MILQALLAYAERRAKESPDFFDEDFMWVDLSWQISLSKDGLLSAVIPLRTKVGKFDRPKRARRPLTDVNEIAVRSLTKAKSYFLSDTVERVLLFNGEGERSTDALVLARHAYFKNMICGARANGAAPEKLDALLRFFSNEAELQVTRQRLLESKAGPDDNLTFAVEGDDLLHDASLIAWWRQQRQSAPTKTHIAVSLVSGSATRCISTASKIKGLGDGDTMLISANESAFNSYHFDKAQNSAIGESEEKQIKAALDELVTKAKADHLLFNDIAYLHWTREPMDNDPLALLTTADPDGVAHLLRSVQSGVNYVGLDDDAYYCLGLCANGTRIVVRQWLESTVPMIRKGIAAWFEAVGIISEDGHRVIHEFSLRDLFATLVPQKKGKPDFAKLPQQISADFITSILSGPTMPLPRTALLAALRRQLIEPYKINAARIALIKACLLRSPTRQPHHTMTNTLDLESRDTAYLCGQLFAVVGRLQLLALGKIGSSIAERTYGGVATRPATTFGPLFTRLPAYFKRANNRFPGSGTNKQKEIEALACRIDKLGGIPKVIDLEGQGRFALGYYCQLAQYRTDRAEAEAAERAELLADDANT